MLAILRLTLLAKTKEPRTWRPPHASPTPPLPAARVPRPHLFLVLSIVLEVIRHRTGYWQLGAFGLGPDLALLLGVGAGLTGGQLHPRAVPLYNALHRVLGTRVPSCTRAAGARRHRILIGALVWCLHISFDRTVGYGLRTRDGFQRS